MITFSLYTGVGTGHRRCTATSRPSRDLFLLPFYRKVFDLTPSDFMDTCTVATSTVSDRKLGQPEVHLTTNRPEAISRKRDIVSFFCIARHYQTAQHERAKYSPRKIRTKCSATFFPRDVISPSKRDESMIP